MTQNHSFKIWNYFQRDFNSKQLDFTQMDTLWKIESRKIHSAYLPLNGEPKHLQLGKYYALAKYLEKVSIGNEKKSGKNLCFRSDKIFACLSNKNYKRIPRKLKLFPLFYSSKKYSYLSTNFTTKSLEWSWMASQDINQTLVIPIDTKHSMFLNQLSKLTPLVMESDAQISTMASKSFISFLNFQRKKIKLFKKVIISSFDQPSIGGLRFLDQNQQCILTNEDIVLGSCKRDCETLRDLFPDINTTYFPFPLQEIRTLKKASKTNSHRSWGSSSNPIRFLFSGRISSQKNLHTFLLGLKLFKEQFSDKHFILEIYGKEDDLGNPHIGLKAENYQDFLKSISSDLNLSDEIKFMGFRQPEIMDQIQSNTDHIFITTSLHADEHFGAAAFTSLYAGKYAILSDWGGHNSLKDYFPTQVTLAKVNHSSYGPHIDPHVVFNAIEEVVQKCSQPQSENKKNYFPSSYVLTRFQSKILDGLNFSPSLNSQMSLLNKSFSQKIPHKKNNVGKHQIFKGYQDPLLSRIVSKYGATKIESTSTKKQSSRLPKLVPWVQKNKNGQFNVCDPIRGSFKLSTKSGAKIEDLGLCWTNPS